MVAAVYDALMATVPHAQWLSRIERAARERGKQPRSALDVACGTGMVTELLRERGYHPLLGFDISPAMVTIARAKAERFPREERPHYEVQDAARLNLGDQTFDLVVSLFDSLNYILEPVALQNAFIRLYAHTAPGGLLAFDLNTLYALSQDLFSQSQQWGPVQHIWKAHWDEETQICRVEMDFWIEDPADLPARERRYFHETHVQRAYRVPEIRRMLATAGFRQVEAFGNYGDRPPGPRTDRVLFVAEKP